MGYLAYHEAQSEDCADWNPKQRYCEIWKTAELAKQHRNFLHIADTADNKHN